jgi:hypothetical protein
VGGCGDAYACGPQDEPTGDSGQTAGTQDQNQGPTTDSNGTAPTDNPAGPPAEAGEQSEPEQQAPEIAVYAWGSVGKEGSSLPEELPNQWNGGVTGANELEVSFGVNTESGYYAAYTPSVGASASVVIPTEDGPVVVSAGGSVGQEYSIKENGGDASEPAREVKVSVTLDEVGGTAGYGSVGEMHGPVMGVVGGPFQVGIGLSANNAGWQVMSPGYIPGGAYSYEAWSANARAPYTSVYPSQ